MEPVAPVAVVTVNDRSVALSERVKTISPSLPFASVVMVLPASYACCKETFKAFGAQLSSSPPALWQTTVVAVVPANAGSLTESFKNTVPPPEVMSRSPESLVISVAIDPENKMPPSVVILPFESTMNFESAAPPAVSERLRSIKLPVYNVVDAGVFTLIKRPVGLIVPVPAEVSVTLI